VFALEGAVEVDRITGIAAVEVQHVDVAAVEVAAEAGASDRSDAGAGSRGEPVPLLG
jgi:hypothetical protein